MEAGTKANKGNILKIILIVLGVSFLIGLLFFLFGSSSGEDVLKYYDDGTLKFNYSVNSEGWSLNYYLKENNLTGLDEDEEIKEISLNLNGEGVFMGYYGNGNKALDIRGIFKDGNLNGEGRLIIYYEDGKKLREQMGTFNDEGFKGDKWIYYEDGKIRTFSDGVFNEDFELNGEGRLIIYDEDGNKSQEQIGTFKLYKLIEGNVYDYNEDGEYSTRKV